MAIKKTLGAVALLLAPGMTRAFAGEADINLPPLQDASFFGGSLSSHAILYFGLAVCGVGALFGFSQYKQTCALPVHKAMSEVSNIIWETCKTYLMQQGKFLVGLWILIAICMIYYFIALEKDPFS